MLIPRILHENLQHALNHSNKILIVYGARQVGKTTLVRNVLKNCAGKVLEINADMVPFIEALSSRDLSKLKELTAGYNIVFIDEAQRIPDIGINLKIIHDQLPDLKMIITGSSSLDLSNRVKEPLTGRTWTYQLYPISAAEWINFRKATPLEIKQQLNEWMRFGMYPEVFSFQDTSNKIRYLRELSEAYLYKDILFLSNIRYPEKLRQILRLLAWQVGNLVSLQEIANSVQISRDAVVNYIDLLEKSFVIFRLGGFSRNLRKEITKMNKIYFYDLGVRNAILGDFNDLDNRMDIGALWENFLIVERIKSSSYHFHFANRYFWRTHTGAELDFVEEYGGNLYGYEFKWTKKDPKAPETWLETYPNAHFQPITQENFQSWLLIQPQ